MILAARTRVLGVVLWACLVASCVAAPTATLRGAIVDSEGAVIGMAHIVIHEDGSGRDTSQNAGDVTRQSDEGGRFSVQLAPGFYDVCIMALGFTPDCRKVRLRPQGTIDISVRLTIDPQVVDELGDRLGF